MELPQTPSFRVEGKRAFVTGGSRGIGLGAAVALADAGAPLRRALINRQDLIVAEKFGEQEQSGAGLADDILNVIAEGLPVLVLVPEPALACWRELTGGETAEVPCEADALRRWWRDRFAGKS